MMSMMEKFRKISKMNPDVWVPLLEKYTVGMSPREINMFLAQAAHESAGFSQLKENLNYSAAGLAKTWPKRYANADGTPNETAIRIQRNPVEIANLTYSGRMGNGVYDESNDGSVFIGRGIFQLTGRTNYERFFAAIKEPLSPEKLETPEYAVRSAVWFWRENKLPQLVHDIVATTRKINGGTIGLDHRIKLYNTLSGIY
jgi:putative chitinase